MVRIIESKNSGWDYWKMPKKYRGPFTYPHYSKDYSSNLIGYVYPPYKSDDPNIESINGYHAELYDEVSGEVIKSKDFSNINSAKTWLDKIANEYNA